MFSLRQITLLVQADISLHLRSPLLPPLFFTNLVTVP
nr:MAG TPA: hypothetical protein [Caudoviricetes sp.]